MTDGQRIAFRETQFIKYLLDPENLEFKGTATVSQSQIYISHQERNSI